MTLQELRDAYYELSGKASDIARQLAFAGIALVWIFRKEETGPIGVPPELLLPSACLVVALGLDLLQYLWGTLVWGLYHRIKERQLGATSSKSFEAPALFNWPSIVLFWAKTILVMFAFWLIFSFIYELLGAR